MEGFGFDVCVLVVCFEVDGVVVVVGVGGKVEVDFEVYGLVVVVVGVGFEYGGFVVVEDCVIVVCCVVSF